MRRALFPLIILALSTCFVLAQNKPSPLSWIEKGFMANPWGTKINELVDGTSLVTDPAQRKNSQKLSCTFDRQQGPEKVYQCPVTVTFEGLNITDVQYLTKWDELTGVGFKAENTENILKIFARDLGAASSPEDGLYIWKKGDVTIQVVDYFGDASITVTYNPPYVNPDPKAAVNKIMSGIFGHAWGTNEEDMKDILGTETEGDVCEDCNMKESKEKNLKLGSVPIGIAKYYVNKDKKLSGALIGFDRKYYNSIVDSVNDNLGTSPYSNNEYAKKWNLKGIYVEVNALGYVSFYQKQLMGLDEDFGIVKKQ
jgi:hypothetical protein